MESTENESGLVTLGLAITGLVGGALLGAYIETTERGEQINKKMYDSCKNGSKQVKRISSDVKKNKHIN